MDAFIRGSIPILRQAEIDKILEELEQAEEFSFTFDGKFHIAELMDTRFVLKGVIQHRVLAFRMLQKSLDGRQEAAWLCEVLRIHRWRALHKILLSRRSCREWSCFGEFSIFVCRGWDI